MYIRKLCATHETRNGDNVYWSNLPPGFSDCSVYVPATADVSNINSHGALDVCCFRCVSSLSEKKNYMMAASAGATEASADQLEELGLVAAHSYGLMKAVLVTDAFGDQVKLVQLRNPWGDFEWNGDWGDDSDLWTDEIKK